MKKFKTCMISAELVEVHESQGEDDWRVHLATFHGADAMKEANKHVSMLRVREQQRVKIEQHEPGPELRQATEKEIQQIARQPIKLTGFVEETANAKYIRSSNAAMECARVLQDSAHPDARNDVKRTVAMRLIAEAMVLIVDKVDTGVVQRAMEFGLIKEKDYA